MCLEEFKLSSDKTQIFSLVFLRSNWASKHMSGFWFFPKSEVIPNHRACSTGETRTMAHLHESFPIVLLCLPLLEVDFWVQ